MVCGVFLIEELFFHNEVSKGLYFFPLRVNFSTNIFFQIQNVFRHLCLDWAVHLLNGNYLLSRGQTLKSDLISGSLMSLKQI